MALQNAFTMIQVIINKIEQKDKLYTVTLGNGCYYEFNQLRKAKAFNCETSRFLTKKILLLNAIYTDLFRLSREYWLISENRQGKGKNQFHNYKKVVDSFELIAYWFEYITSYRCDAGVYSFVCVDKITREFELLFDVFNKGFDSFPSYSYSVDIEKAKYINRQIIKEIHSYGMDNCTKVISLLANDFENHLTESFLQVG